MAKRSAKELETFLEDDDVDEVDPREIVKEKKMKTKKTTVTPVEDAADTDTAGTSSSIFDEIMVFNDEQDKFQKTIQISPTEGIGLTSNYISLFRISKKNGKEEISAYQFNIKNSVIPNLLIALRKIIKFNNEKKK